MSKLVYLFAGLFVSSVVLANNNATPLKDVYKLPVWVDQVQRVCPWKSKAGSGYVRMIRTEVDGRHGLFLQWVRKGIAGAPTQPTSTVLVEELTHEFPVRLEMPKAKLLPNSCQLSATAENINTERRYMMTFTLKGPGSYDMQVTRLYEGGL